MFKFINRKLYIRGFNHGLKKGFREGYKRGEMLGSKGFIGLNPKEFSVYVDMYNKIEKFAIRVNQASFRKYKFPSPLNKESVLTRNALWMINARAVTLHKSILMLCEAGWASVAPVISRSLMDCLINSIAITKKDNEYMAFRFFSHEYLNQQLDVNFKQDIKDLSMGEVSKMLKKLNDQNQRKAKIYIQSFLRKGKPKGYWYKPEYRNVEQIITYTEWYKIFKVLSMSVHSTFMGSSLFKDQSDKVGINPRTDPKSTKMALVASSRILLETISIRDAFEKLNFSSETQALRMTIANLKKGFLDSYPELDYAKYSA